EQFADFGLNKNLLRNISFVFIKFNIKGFNMINLLSVFIGGGIGSVLRWLCCQLITNHWGTFVVNVLGAFFIGVAYTYFEKYTNLPPATKTFIMTGLLGGFTTFSTYLLNFTTLFNQNSHLEACLYLIGSVVVGAVFLILGMKALSFIQ
ncbi:MAG: CrcB family protein, partial [Alphaproteobacteria bacterium]|nr:CrcB family protein [Alphaproteobacteria bacterium]